AAGKTDRCYRRNHRPGRSGLAWTQLDGQEAQAVDLPDVRPGRGTKHHPPRLAPGRPDVEEGQEAAGQGPAPEAGCPCPGTAEAVHRVCDGEVLLIYVDEVHIHRDLDLGYTWGRRGERLWRKGDCPKLQDRMNAYGAYDFSNGECFLWQNGWCNGEQTVLFLHALLAWRAGKKGRLVLIWDNAPCHVAKTVTAEAARLGIAIVNLPGYSPDLNPLERLWAWIREEVTRGFCHQSVPDLIAACQA